MSTWTERYGDRDYKGRKRTPKCACGARLYFANITYSSGGDGSGLLGFKLRTYRCKSCGAQYEGREFVYRKGEYPMLMAMRLNQVIDKIASGQSDAEIYVYRVALKCGNCGTTRTYAIPMGQNHLSTKCKTCGAADMSLSLDKRV